MSKYLLLWLVLCGLGMPAVQAGPAFQPVAAFQAGPATPENSSLLKHPDGFFYGTSRSGGAYGHGTLYRLSGAGALSVMVHFTGNNGLFRGRRPQAGLIADASGLLWGTTVQGGSGNLGDGFGTVFRYNPATGNFATVVYFTGTGGSAKGTAPQAGLVGDGSGQLWGTTVGGGTNGAGTVFRVNPATLVFSNVLDFTGTAGANRGRAPQAAMVADGAGLLWGTTAEGGANGVGTLFSLNAASGVLSTLFDFTGTAGTFPGGRPVGALREVGAGIWWGTTSAGGTGGLGTVFRYMAAGGGFAKILDFTGNSGAVPGRAPASALVPDGGGFLFGTTNGGGAGDAGTVFKLDTTSLAYGNVVQFTGTAGAFPGIAPGGTLIPDGEGFLRGTLASGGGAQLGGIYKINPATGAFAPVINFTRTLGTVPASNPGSGLIPGPDGLLWGTSEKGGAINAGTIFTVNPLTGVTAPVLEFTGTGGAARGLEPSAELIDDGAGHFWGTTASGGTGNFGVVFKINAVTRAYTDVVNFTGLDGRGPNGRLLADGHGYIWGTTATGGADSNGTVFRIAIDTGILTTMVQFTGTTGAYPGDGPAAGLNSDGQGFLWGTTYEGGSSNLGTVFKIDRTTGAFVPVLSFSGQEGDFKGEGPESVLAMDPAGFVWGTTGFGGAEDLGTVFKINRTTGSLTTVVEFDGPGGTFPGTNPKSGLIRDLVGAWYGTTESGGDDDLGTIYKITAEGTYSTIYHFTGPSGLVPGAKPRGELMLFGDGHFYGTTTTGGALDAATPGGNGQVFRLRFGPVAVTTFSPVDVTQTTAVLKGSVDPNGAVSTVSFEYGTSPTLAGASVISAGTTAAGPSPENVSAALTGLLPSTVYYYRARAFNAENPNFQRGGILSLTTAAGTSQGFVGWLNAAGVAGGASAAGDDADGDGVANALEFVLGGNPSATDRPALPAAVLTPDEMVFSFLRQDVSETSDVVLLVEAGDSLGSWPEVYQIRATGPASDGNVTVDENGGAPDQITIRIPRNAGAGKFVRLKVGIAP